ncbi:MAG: truncated hemoglobin [Myxococcota bacterium]
MSEQDQDWRLSEEVGGEERLRALVYDFYERVFDDPIIGFFFAGSDIDDIVDAQVQYVRARLGSEDVEYTGKAIRKAHLDHPILTGHFDRRHQILRETLEAYDVPEHVRDAWLDLEQRLRDLVVRTGAQAREKMLGDTDSET